MRARRSAQALGHHTYTVPRTPRQVAEGVLREIDAARALVDGFRGAARSVVSGFRGASRDVLRRRFPSIMATYEGGHGLLATGLHALSAIGDRRFEVKIAGIELSIGLKSTGHADPTASHKGAQEASPQPALSPIF